MDVKVTLTFYIQTRANHTFTHNWTNIRTATVWRNAIGSDACQQFRDLLHVGPDLQRRGRREP